jgi:hypothetical protein
MVSSTNNVRWCLMSSANSVLLLLACEQSALSVGHRGAVDLISDSTGGNVTRKYIVATLLTNNAICLVGTFITIIGLQASVGTWSLPIACPSLCMMVFVAPTRRGDKEGLFVEKLSSWGVEKLSSTATVHQESGGFLAVSCHVVLCFFCTAQLCNRCMHAWLTHSAMCCRHIGGQIPHDRHVGTCQRQHQRELPGVTGRFRPAGEGADILCPITEYAADDHSKWKEDCYRLSITFGVLVQRRDEPAQ